MVFMVIQNQERKVVTANDLKVLWNNPNTSFNIFKNMSLFLESLNIFVCCLYKIYFGERNTVDQFDNI